MRLKERDEIAAIGRKLFDEIAERLPSKIGKKAIKDAVKRLGFASEAELMIAIGTAKLDDRAVMEALVPGSAADLAEPDDWPKQERAISIRGLTAGHGVPAGRVLPPGAG